MAYTYIIPGREPMIQLRYMGKDDDNEDEFYLMVRDVGLWDRECERILRLLSERPHTVRSIGFGKVAITDVQAFTKVIETIRDRCTRVASLMFAGVGFTPDRIRIVMECIEASENITRLVLYDDAGRWPEIGAIIIQALPNTKITDLEVKNFYYETFPHQLARLISERRLNLQRLDMEHMMQLPDIIQFAESLVDSSIEELSLLDKNPNYTRDELIQLFTVLGRCTNLKEFNVEMVDVQLHGFDFAGLLRVEKLVIGNNHKLIEYPDDFIKAILGNPNLKKIGFDDAPLLPKYDSCFKQIASKVGLLRVVDLFSDPEKMPAEAFMERIMTQKQHILTAIRAPRMIHRIAGSSDVVVLPVELLMRIRDTLPEGQ